MTSKQAHKIFGVSSTEHLSVIEAKYQTLLRSFQYRLLPGNSLMVRQQAQQQIIELENAIYHIRKLAKKQKSQAKSAPQTLQATPLHQMPMPQVPDTPPSSAKFETPFDRWLYRFIRLLVINGRAACIWFFIVLIIMWILVAACVKGCDLQELTQNTNPASVIDTIDPMKWPSKSVVNTNSIMKGY